MAGKFLFTSKRLGFRVMKDSDFDALFEISSDPEVMRYYPQPDDREKTRQLIARMNILQQERGYSLYAVEHLKRNKFIGFIGFLWFRWETFFGPCEEIGWRLHKDYWNEGLATEGAEACLRFGFGELGFRSIHAVTSIPNKPSERVMQKIGMTRIGEFEHPGIEAGSHLREHVVYRIQKPELQATRAQDVNSRISRH
jgi:ribosomal-protein-alanine N-acetyltransferase